MDNNKQLENIKKIDKEIEEMTKKLKEVKKGYDKTIHDFTKEIQNTSLISKQKLAYNRLNFSIKSTIQDPLIK
jgi:predicted  nucleic acid-binding Zn-ribbon protein